MLPLSDGYDIPQLFVPAFRCPTVEETRERICMMFDIGLRHFEIAELFGNAHTVVASLSEICPREDIYITYKVWNKDRNAARVVSAVKSQMERMGLTYFDLLMVHAPVDVENRADQYKCLEDLKDEGVTRSIGLVNYSSVLLQDLLKNCRVTPVVFELESHPFYQNSEMVEYCNDSSIVLMNTEPLAKGLKYTSKQLIDIAERCEMSVTQLLLSWAYAKGMCVGISGKNVHIDQEIGSLDFEKIEDKLAGLPAEIVAELDLLDDNRQTSWVPVEYVPPEDTS